MFGLGPVPWPFVRRSRFVRELSEKGELYRSEVYAAEQKAWRAEQKAARLTTEYADALNTLSGWYAGGETVQVLTEDGEPPQHFNMKYVRDFRGQRYTFMYDVSLPLFHQMKNYLDPRQAGQLLFAVTEGLVARVIRQMYEEGGA